VLLVLALMMRPERPLPAAAGAANDATGGAEGAAVPGSPEGAPAVGPAEGAAGEEGAAAAGGGGTAPAPAAEPSPAFAAEANRREVVLFFQKSDGDSLGPERRKIFLTSSIADQAKQIVVELINGPQDADLLPTLPPETRLLGLYLDRAGAAFVDLSPEASDYHPGGSAEELATIFSLVDSLTYNLPEIQRVRILIGGEERDTLKSHLDLRRDYRQDLSIVDMDRRPGR
jgi:hypothetical protein